MPLTTFTTYDTREVPTAPRPLAPSQVCEMTHRANMAARIHLLESALRTAKIEAAHALRNRVGSSDQDVELTRESLATIEATARLALGEFA